MPTAFVSTWDSSGGPSLKDWYIQVDLKGEHTESGLLPLAGALIKAIREEPTGPNVPDNLFVENVTRPAPDVLIVQAKDLSTDFVHIYMARWHF